AVQFGFGVVIVDGGADAGAGGAALVVAVGLLGDAGDDARGGELGHQGLGGLLGVGEGDDAALAQAAVVDGDAGQRGQGGPQAGGKRVHPGGDRLQAEVQRVLG